MFFDVSPGAKWSVPLSSCWKSYSCSTSSSPSMSPPNAVPSLKQSSTHTLKKNTDRKICPKIKKFLGSHSYDFKNFLEKSYAFLIYLKKLFRPKNEKNLLIRPRIISAANDPISEKLTGLNNPLHGFVCYGSFPIWSIDSKNFCGCSCWTLLWIFYVVCWLFEHEFSRLWRTIEEQL